MSGALTGDMRQKLVRGPLAELDGNAALRAISYRLGDFPDAPLPATLFLDGQLGLADDMLHYFDRASMAHSLEVRVPFLDHHFVELCASMPANLKVHRKGRSLETKHVLKHAARGLVPDRIIDKPKIGFFNSAVDGWFRAQTRGAISRLPARAEPALRRDARPQRGRAARQGPGGRGGRQHLRPPLGPDARGLAVGVPAAGAGGCVGSGAALALDCVSTRELTYARRHARPQRGGEHPPHRRRARRSGAIAGGLGRRRHGLHGRDARDRRRAGAGASLDRRRSTLEGAQRSCPRRPDRARVRARATRASTRSPTSIVKLDADTSFEPGYFARLLGEFAADPQLGMASGTCHELEDGVWRERHVTGSTVWGASRCYRRECLAAGAAARAADGLGRGRRVPRQRPRLEDARRSRTSRSATIAARASGTAPSTSRGWRRGVRPGTSAIASGIWRSARSGTPARSRPPSR